MTLKTVVKYDEEGAMPSSTKNHKKRVTQAEVATAAGVSRSVVSFVLNERTDQRIPEDTAAHVREVAEKLGYRPNKVANTLRSGKSGTIAFVSDFVSTTSAANAMIKGALASARAHDTLMFTAETLGQERLEELLLNELLDRQVDGIIYASMFTRAVHLPTVLHDIPYVLLNCMNADSSSSPYVIPDEYNGGRTAANLLLEAGHTSDIFFIGTFPGKKNENTIWPHMPSLALPQRLMGIRDALHSRGVELAGQIDISGDWNAENGYTVTKKLLKKHKPTALICANDAIAFGAYQAITDCGLAIPEDLSVIAFDGTPLSKSLRPQLTSIALPHEDMGVRATDLLLSTSTATSAVHELIDMPVLRGGSISTF